MSEDVVIVSTADWDNPFWTNKQHVACELARRGHRVLYVESLGLRRISATRSDLFRIWGRLRKGLRPPRKVQNTIWVWSPLLVPLNHLAGVRAVNGRLLQWGLRYWCWRIGLRQPMLWTYSPMTTRLLRVESFAPVVYHCVDEVKAQPGMPKSDIEAAERDLVKRSDVVFVTAKGLLAERKALNSNTYYFSNVSDFRHFSTALEPGPVPADLEALPQPRIGFVGAISSYKLDLKLLAQVARSRPAWSFALIGKVGEGEPWTDISDIEGVSNIHLVGSRPYAELPKYLRGIDVTILPSALNEYTAGMFPMKFFEYLAAGKPVVATRLPALSDYADIAHLADGPEAFVSGIENALAGRGAPLDRRLAVARENTYEGRTGKMLDLIRVTRRAVAPRANRTVNR